MLLLLKYYSTILLFSAVVSYDLDVPVISCQRQMTHRTSTQTATRSNKGMLPYNCSFTVTCKVYNIYGIHAKAWFTYKCFGSSICLKTCTFLWWLCFWSLGKCPHLLTMDYFARICAKGGLLVFWSTMYLQPCTSLL